MTLFTEISSTVTCMLMTHSRFDGRAPAEYSAPSIVSKRASPTSTAGADLDVSS